MPVILTKRFDRAMLFAIHSHQGQIRKGCGAPYISHPIAVSSLVLEYGGTENQAIAALLHDVIEDCSVKEGELKLRFGADVARIVVDCSDYFGLADRPKPPWRPRKEAYISRLSTVGAASLLVSAADKLHNARCIVHDVTHRGSSAWERFHASPPEILWYYESVLKAFKMRKRANLKIVLAELNAWVAKMSTLINDA